MKKLIHSILMGSFLVLWACSSSSESEVSQQMKTSSEIEVFGKDPGEGDAISVTDMIGEVNSEEIDSMDTRIEGVVVEVCKKKGCWMTLDAGNGETIRVTFKDYGFFVPKDSEGAKVILEGTATSSPVSVDMQRHYAEDAGESKEEVEKITEPLRQISFVASGVKMKKEIIN